jgi:hypothetical protein
MAPKNAFLPLTSSWASDSLEKRVPKLGSGNGPCSETGAPVSKHAMSSNPPGGGKGMGKFPGGGLTKVFSSFLQEANNGSMIRHRAESKC